MMHQPYDYDDLYCRGFGIDPDLHRERMGMLNFEQEKAMCNMPYRSSSPNHDMDFKCQCKRCVRLHTITMDDRKFLDSIRILWKAPVEKPSPEKA